MKFDHKIGQIVEIIRQHPGRKPLVIHHKPSPSEEDRRH